MSRSARRQVDFELSVRRRRQQSCASDVVGNRAHFDAGIGERRTKCFRSVENGVHDSVVAEVRPGVVHVEDGDVEAVAVGRRRRIAGADELEEIVVLVDIAFLHQRGHDASGMPCSVSEMM